MIERRGQAGGEHQCDSKDRSEGAPGTEGPSAKVDKRQDPDHSNVIAGNCDPFKSGSDDSTGGSSATELEQKLQTDQPNDQCREQPVEPSPCEPVDVRPRAAPSCSRRLPAPTLSRSSDFFAHRRQVCLLTSVVSARVDPTRTCRIDDLSKFASCNRRQPAVECLFKSRLPREALSASVPSGKEYGRLRPR